MHCGRKAAGGQHDSDEGATGWADTTMMYARASHPNCAYKWLEWSLSPKVQGDVAARFGSLRRYRPPAPTTRCSARGLQDQRRESVRQAPLLAHA